MGNVDMQGVLQTLRSMAAQAADTRKTTAVGGTTGGFAQALSASLDKINGMQQVATGEANAFQAGKPGVALYNVMIDQQEASLALQMGVQTRNRLVDAYKQIMNMQV